MKVAVVESDAVIGDCLVNQLNCQGHEALHKRHGDDLLLSHSAFDVVILDTDLLDVDGVSLLRLLRKVSAVPVVVMATDNSERAVMRILRCGADDFVAKPPRIGELQARLEAVVRRGSRRQPEPREPVVVSRDVRVDLAAQVVEVGGARIGLTPKEFELVRLLLEHPGAVVSRERLMDRIWGHAFASNSRVLDVHMATLRAKLHRPGMITTIHGVGYRWELARDEELAERHGTVSDGHAGAG